MAWPSMAYWHLFSQIVTKSAATFNTVVPMYDRRPSLRYSVIYLPTVLSAVVGLLMLMVGLAYIVHRLCGKFNKHVNKGASVFFCHLFIHSLIR